MPSPPSQPAASEPAANAPGPASRMEERAILNTLYNSGGEIAGRLASLLLFAVAGHALGENGLGSFVFAVAFLGFVIVPVDIGLDRYMLRAIARERSSSENLFFNVLALKLSLALPLFGAAVLGLHLVGYDHAAQLTTLALVPGTICDSIARSQFAVFMANERSGPPAFADATQRICSAVLGIAALKAGFGVVSVAVTYSIGSFVGVVLGFVLLPRTIGMPARRVSRRGWRALASGSVPFASQDIFATLLARVDTVILALIATQAAVGSYGAAYRLFESTLFVTYALAGAFAAMFTYLSPNSDPPLRSVYQRSIKLSLILLVPIAAAFTVVGGPICRLIYGDNFSSASVPLGILGPGVVLLGVVTLTTSLLVSRENPRRMVPVAAVMAVFNIALNLVLIPLYGAGGAAAAMLVTEAIYAIWIMRMAARAVHGFALLRTTGGALVAGAGMAIVALLLHDSLPLALVCGGAIYLVTLLVVERLLSPHDVELIARLVRQRFPSGQSE